LRNQVEIRFRQKKRNIKTLILKSTLSSVENSTNRPYSIILNGFNKGIRENTKTKLLLRWLLSEVEIELIKIRVKKF